MATMAIWTVGDALWAGHDSSDLVYLVELAFSSPQARDRVWADLREHHPTDGDDVLHGGACLTRVDEADVHVVSGGQDALDSLDAAVNDVLADAMRRVGQDAAIAVHGVHRSLRTDDDAAFEWQCVDGAS